jgi:hypothetical protein
MPKNHSASVFATSGRTHPPRSRERCSSSSATWNIILMALDAFCTHCLAYSISRNVALTQPFCKLPLGDSAGCNAYRGLMCLFMQKNGMIVRALSTR